MSSDIKNLYENGFACVRHNPGTGGMIARYEVLFSEDGNLNACRSRTSKSDGDES